MEKDNVIPFLLLLYRAIGKYEIVEGQAVIEDQLMKIFCFYFRKIEGEGEQSTPGSFYKSFDLSAISD